MEIWIKLLGLVFIVVGGYLSYNYKEHGLIGTPEPHPSIQTTTFNYSKLMIGICLIVLGILLLSGEIAGV